MRWAEERAKTDGQREHRERRRLADNQEEEHCLDGLKTRNGTLRAGTNNHDKKITQRFGSFTRKVERLLSGVDPTETKKKRDQPS